MMNDRIPTLPDALLSLIRHGENYQVEYKEARTDLPKSLFDSVCAFSNREGGDIFLGITDDGKICGVPEKAAPDMYNETGTSVVIIRTRKGNQLFESVRNNLCCREVTYSAAAESNPAEYRSVYKPDDREKFFSDYRKMSFEQLIKKYPRPARLPLKRRVKKILKHGFSAEPERKMPVSHSNFGTEYLWKQ